MKTRGIIQCISFIDALNMTYIVHAIDVCIGSLEMDTKL